MKRKIPTLAILLLYLVVILIVAQSVLAPPTPFGISGYVSGPGSSNAAINVTAYTVNSSTIQDTENTTTNINGTYSIVLNIPEGVGFIDVVVNASNPPAYGINTDYSNSSVSSNPEINITTSAALILLSPNTGITTSNNTPEFIWNYSNFTGSYYLQIDNESTFSSPLVHNISSPILNLTLNSTQNLSDNTYFWRVQSYNSSIFDTSSSRNFTVDTLAPSITLIDPTNNSWTNDSTQDITLTTNENGQCMYNTSAAVVFASKPYLLAGATTAHTTTLNLSVQGPHYFYFQCNDTIGNIMDISNEYNYTLNFDNVSPIANYTFQYNGTWISTNASIQLNTSDATPGSGINWTRYCTGAGCSPTTGSVYTTNISISANGTTILRFAAQDNASNTQDTQQITIQIDRTPPNTTDNFSSHDVWVNDNVSIALTVDDPAESSGINWTYYCTDNNTCTPLTTYTIPINFTTEGIQYLRYHSQDVVGNTQDVQTIIIKIDQTPPNVSSASVVVESGSTYTTNSTLDFTWSGFHDNSSAANVSEISTYYYNLTDNENTSNGYNDTASPGQITNANEGTQTVYIWAQDLAGNIGTSVSDSIIVDTVKPIFIPINNTNITENSVENLTLNLNITEVTSGVSGNPTVRYKYNDSDSFSNWTNMSQVVDTQYTFNISPPTGGWNVYRTHNVSWQFNTTDNATNNNVSSIYKDLVESINDAPTLNTIQNQSVLQGNTLTFNISGLDVDNDGIESQTLTFTLNHTNITLTQSNNTFATITWAPNNTFVGNNSVLITLNDTSLVATQVLIITVNDTNDVPIIITSINLTAFENQTFTYDVNATDLDLDTLTFTDNSSLFIINTSTGIINFTPNSTQVGVYSINLTVNDSNGGVDTETIQLNISDVFSVITFNVTDSLFGRNLSTVTATGGENCDSGCVFNHLLNVTENNSVIPFNFTKTGFAINSSTFTITEDTTINITMSDNQNPNLTKATVGRYTSGGSFYINLTLNVSDNFDLENTTLSYSIVPLDESNPTTNGVKNYTVFDGILHNLTLGPFSYSVKMVSNQTAYDEYNNSNTTYNDETWFILVDGNLSINYAPVLGSIGNITATVEKEFTLQVSAADANEDTLVFNDNSTIFNINSSSGYFNFTPNSTQVGNYSTYINVTDSIATDSESFTVFIVETTCGDAFCGSTESCSSCSADCGSCPATSSSSSSGGGGGGSSSGGGGSIIYRDVTKEVIVEVPAPADTPTQEEIPTDDVNESVGEVIDSIEKEVPSKSTDLARKRVSNLAGAAANIATNLTGSVTTFAGTMFGAASNLAGAALHTTLDAGNSVFRSENKKSITQLLITLFTLSGAISSFFLLRPKKNITNVVDAAEYILNRRKKFFETDTQITQTLRKAGWKKNEIQEALKHAESSQKKTNVGK
jgi:hypothetical protein